jgi:gliding motility-associated lipoprotein GldD
MLRYILAIAFLLFISSCRPQVFVPKPPGYFKIDTPAWHEYQVFDRPGYPYSFEYPVYANIENDTVFMEEKADNPYWININIPCLNAVINITYKQISAKQPLNKLVNDAHNLSFFHHEIADYIEPHEFRNGFGTSGLLYVVGGNSASRYQFTATDSVKHFIRGAMYFDVTPNADSLKPANDFMEQDIQHLLKTLRWKY